MKLLLAMCLILLSTGCMKRVDSADVRAALYACSTHDGFDFMGAQSVYCNDGSIINIYEAYEMLQKRGK